ncbi:MAG: glycosyltransferase [Chitinophagaceae bacterium]|nr:glycosyltransferase [Chitinophagaceae bacterium]
MMKLTIAIPTYNRAKRLRKALLDLCCEINTAIYKSNIAVFISNNGSEDNTSEVIAFGIKLFKENGIPVSANIFQSNQGFDANVLACYANSSGDYIWFLSDDDNIIPGAIDKIMVDIIKYNPSVAFFNHDQKPHDLVSPYIEEYQYFDQITSENITSLQKIINWPKLTSLVIRNCDAGQKVVNLNSGFAHVALALQCGLSLGRVLHSPVFTASPDDDYLDHINFVPHIGNNLDEPIRFVLRLNNKMFLYEKFGIPYLDPLISCLNTLGAYYRGQHVLTVPLKKELWATVKLEFRNGWLKRLRNWKSLKELIKFPISIILGFAKHLLLGKKQTKERNIIDGNSD